ncbi:TPA: hypothetical protein DIV48_02130 [Candidatus Kaiserbacteria bacterium]|nr:MAG: hypothetical protein UY93_C0001G0053 [Parcubacteria group bacterium GW2011_GWA1_56_13]KKW46965.1 MAG: hypothetical protein UY97_C0001G0022 [Parcubacteria group bacterium GW2011_GWB1_57_6]HCR52425.1 hypothetical protein [Candidatus Kaiserbacteria bacterium]
MENKTFIPRDEPVRETIPTMPESSVPPSAPFPGTPSPKAQSWGVVISIIIIMLMIIVGAFYAWGKRIAQERALIAPTADQ